MTERRGTKALELWCRRITDGYPGVNVQNMTTSWRDGLAFCAMIHHFRPDLIDFDSLNKDDVYGNNEMAFRTAAEHLGIPALLDAEDMASCSVPDRLSILTYLSQFYQNFGGSSPSRLALSRTKESSNEGISPVVPESTKPKMGPRAGMRREPCAVCGMPVFLAEKLMISRTPYHRTCFRCARCKNQLTPGNYYETEDGQYCCETCPDEELKKSSVETILHEAYNDAMINDREHAIQNSIDDKNDFRRSLSDEEKTARKSQSTKLTFDTKNFISESSIDRETNFFDPTPITESISQTAQMRLNFMASHMLSENITKLPIESVKKIDDVSSRVETIDEATTTTTTTTRSGSSSPGKVSNDENGSKGAKTLIKGFEGPVDATNIVPSRSPTTDRKNNYVDNISLSESSIFEEINRNDCDKIKSNDVELINDSFDTATNEAKLRNNHKSYLEDNEKSVRRDTKDTIGPDIDREDFSRSDEIVNTEKCLSLVQRRLKMFENAGTTTSTVDGTKIESKIASSSSRIVVDDDDSVVTENIIENENRNEATTDRREKSLFDNEEMDSPSMIDDNDETNNLNDFTSSEKSETRIPPIVPKRSKNIDEKVLNAEIIDPIDDRVYPKDLNPFDSDDDEKSVKIDGDVEDTRGKKVSTNPFGSSDEDEEDNVGMVATSMIVAAPRPAARMNVTGKMTADEIAEYADEAPTKRRLKAPQIHLNPFWSDDDGERDSEDENGVNSLTIDTPVPKPRTITQTPHRNTEADRRDMYASNSSLGSIESSSTPGGTFRKKKPAPPPPIAKELFSSGADFSLTPNRRSHMGSNNSLHTTPRARKNKPAPPPPMPTSTPCGTNLMANLSLTESPITDSGITMESEDYKTWNDLKIGKDEANRSKQSMTTISCDETSMYGGYADKSIQGKWKRKKGPAPARPMPHRRKIKVMSLKDVKLELDEIEVQQQGLERQGVRLEQLIRDKAETGVAAEETNVSIDVEELVLELFVLVNEKNELFRRQAELMLLRRQQRLEEEHADIEYQIRCLLCQPEATKTDFDKQREETLIQRLVEIVERRNEIVECLEMDRRREVEEDRSINTRMGAYTAKNKGDFAKDSEDEESHRSQKSKKTKLKDKAKEKILRKGHKKDADKDVDETEVKVKRQNKRKWF